jgi:hypothetical protein
MLEGDRLQKKKLEGEEKWKQRKRKMNHWRWRR